MKKTLKHGELSRFARHLGEPAERVRGWWRREKLNAFITDDGRIDTEPAAAVIYGRIAPKQQQAINKRWHGSKSNTPPPPKTENDLPTYLDETIGELAKLDVCELQRRNELEKLLMARIKRQKEEGELIPLEQAKSECFTAFRLMRDAILNIPDREAASLMNVKTEKQFKAKLTAALRQPLNDLQKFKHIRREGIR